MSYLKCLVCNNRINTPKSNRRKNHNDNSQSLLKTVCSLLDLDLDSVLNTCNFPLSPNSPNVFCETCQVIAVKLLNLQNNLFEIQHEIKVTIATITTTIVQTETQQERERQRTREKENKSIEENEQDEQEKIKENKQEIKLISRLRKIVRQRYSPVIKITQCPTYIKTQTQRRQNKIVADNSIIPTKRKRGRPPKTETTIKIQSSTKTPIENITTTTTTENNEPTKTTTKVEGGEIKKIKLDTNTIDSTLENEEEENEPYYDDGVHDDYNNDDDDDNNSDNNSSIGESTPSKNPTETNNSNANENPDNDFNLPPIFDPHKHARRTIIWETPDDDGPPQQKEVTRWKCPKCPIEYTQARNLRKHYMKRHEPTGIRRPQIKRLRSIPIPEKPGCFMYAEKWEYEMKEEEGMGIFFTCLTCNLQRKTKVAMTKHIDLDHNFSTKLECFKCKKSFVQESALQLHQCVPPKGKKKSRAKELPDGSFIYDDKFPFVKVEDDAADVDGPGFIFQCCVCNAKRNQYFSIMTHMKTQHANPSPNPLCSECGKVFATAQVLRNHIRSVHSNVAEFTCEICGRPFKTKTILYNHKQHVHSEIKVKCPTEGCESIFSTLINLRKHCRRTGHTLPQVPYWNEPQIVTCSRCDSKFRNIRTLKVHEFTCIGVKKKPVENPVFSCRECEKTFFSWTLCREHEFTHRKERLESLTLSLSSSSTDQTTTTTETPTTTTITITTTTVESESESEIEATTITTQNSTEPVETKNTTASEIDHVSVRLTEVVENTDVESQQNFAPDMFSLQDNFYTE